MSLPSPLAQLMGDAARPYVLIATGTAAAISIVQTAIYAPNAEGALFITAVLAGVTAIFHSKAWEEKKKADANASVEIARAQSTTPDTGA